MPFDLNVTDELLATTRAVRKRLDLDRPVPRDVITECLELAVQAPTASNRQTWRWVVVDDPAVIGRLADIYRGGKPIDFRDASAAAAGQGDAQTARVYDSAAWLSDNLHKVPVIVIPCVEGRPPVAAPPEAVPATMSAIYGSIMPAVWNFQLALRSRGLGSTLTTIHLFREQEAAELLNIPEDILQVALLPVAYTKGTDFKRAKRPPVSGITHWNRW